MTMDRTGGMASRKLRHIDACLHGPVEYETVTTGFENYRLPYNALTQTNLGTVDLSTGFLGSQLRAPVLIGGDDGRRGAVPDDQPQPCRGRPEARRRHDARLAAHHA